MQQIQQIQFETQRKVEEMYRETNLNRAKTKSIHEKVKQLMMV